MTAASIIAGLITTIGFYFVAIRDKISVWRQSFKYCDLFLLKHMIPDNHPFRFFYFGLPRTRSFPRIKGHCINVLACASLTVIAAIWTVIVYSSGAQGSNTDLICGWILIIAIIATCGGLLLLTIIRNKLCKRQMEKMRPQDLLKIRREIKRKWPGFYK